MKAFEWRTDDKHGRTAVSPSTSPKLQASRSGSFLQMDSLTQALCDLSLALKAMEKPVQPSAGKFHGFFFRPPSFLLLLFFFFLEWDDERDVSNLICDNRRQRIERVTGTQGMVFMCINQKKTFFLVRPATQSTSSAEVIARRFLVACSNSPVDVDIAEGTVAAAMRDAMHTSLATKVSRRYLIYYILDVAII